MSGSIRCSPGCCADNPIVIEDCACDTFTRFRTVNVVLLSERMDREALLSGAPGSSDELNLELDSARGPERLQRFATESRDRRSRSPRRRSRTSWACLSFGVLCVISAFIVVRVLNMIGELLLYVMFFKLMLCLSRARFL